MNLKSKKPMKNKRKTIWGFLIIQMAFSLIFLSGCGDRQVETIISDVGIGPTKATQRPYVIRGIRHYPIPSARGFREIGIASWYGGKFHGRRTANGEIFNKYAMTAAHKTLPMGTILRVENFRNGKEIVVRINDRGPFIRGRIIDLSYKAAKRLGMVRSGIDKVRITALYESVAKRHAPAPILLIKPQHTKIVINRFNIRVQSFTNRKEAIILAEELTRSGKDATIQQFPAAGTFFYRVLVGGGKTIDEAWFNRESLAENGFPHAVVKQVVVQ